MHARLYVVVKEGFDLVHRKRLLTASNAMCGQGGSEQVSEKTFVFRTHAMTASDGHVSVDVLVSLSGWMWQTLVVRDPLKQKRFDGRRTREPIRPSNPGSESTATERAYVLDHRTERVRSKQLV